MKLHLGKRKTILLLIWSLFILIFITGLNQTILLNKAHSSFENYYHFRGCKQLVSKSESEGVCRLASGKTIKLVNHKGKWYLDGDLPRCWFGNAACF
jgi:hypothetical protein